LLNIDALAASGPVAITNQVPLGTLEGLYRIVTPRKP
jgi:hypothetical protein